MPMGNDLSPYLFYRDAMSFTKHSHLCGEALMLLSGRKKTTICSRETDCWLRRCLRHTLVSLTFNGVVIIPNLLCKANLSNAIYSLEDCPALSIVSSHMSMDIFMSGDAFFYQATEKKKCFYYIAYYCTAY